MYFVCFLNFDLNQKLLAHRKTKQMKYSENKIIDTPILKLAMIKSFSKFVEKIRFKKFVETICHKMKHSSQKNLSKRFESSKNIRQKASSNKIRWNKLSQKNRRKNRRKKPSKKNLINKIRQKNSSKIRQKVKPPFSSGQSLRTGQRA